MKIYTKTGDKGMTSLFGGSRVKKSNALIESYGCVDELNSFLGNLIALCKYPEINTKLVLEQHHLFNVGSILATGNEEFLASMPKVEQSDIEALEQWMDEMNESLPELKNFILPGGSEVAAAAHICRTICRRAERRVVELDLSNEHYQMIVPYLNRLSDAFFVLSRYLLKLDNLTEVHWKK